MTDTLQVFCDGSCIRNGYWDARGGYAVVVMRGEHELYRYSATLKSDETHTNQRAELSALAHAINYLAESNQSGDIYTDSNYSLQVLTTWAPKWSVKFWMKADNKPVLNQDIIQPLYDLWLVVKDTIRLHHVRAHTGRTDALSRGNALVDHLAQSAAASIPIRTAPDATGTSVVSMMSGGSSR